MLQAPAKSGGCSVVLSNNLAAGLTIPAAEFHDDGDVDHNDGCNVTAFCFVFNSSATPSSTIYKNDGADHVFKTLAC
jgi:hypothetical protein